jgi:omega-6 fatty acid desaturase (delta-12 desaturase)
MTAATKTPTASSATPPARSWQKLVQKYQNPTVARSLEQVATSFLPFMAAWAVAYWLMNISYWLGLPVAVLAGGFLMRIFIILHDCGHGSFFKSQRANNFVGSLAGVFSMTPYFQWRHNHAVHHATSGDLDRRASWDLPLTFTVKEYLALPTWQKVLYRLYRHPLILFGLAPTLLFVFAQRLVSPKSGKRERWSVHFTNWAVLALFMVLGYFLGFAEVLRLQLTITVIGATIGVWLFYIQHQFEDTYWEHKDEWDYTEAALYGSSYLKLPKILQWFTGNIGLHHIHHLSARIPNYELQRCHDENPEFQAVNTITLFTSLKCISLRLWDEETQKLVGFSHLKSVPAA